jgi:hypothetical protein
MAREHSNYSVGGFTLLGVIFAALGWGSLYLLVTYTLPTIGPRWLFFFLVMLAMSGTFLPITAYLNKRFSSNPPIEGSVVLREAIWWGIYGDLLAWLQLGRLLTSDIAMFIFFGFIVLEFFFRLREQSQWKPKEHQSE